RRGGLQAAREHRLLVAHDHAQRDGQALGGLGAVGHALGVGLQRAQRGDDGGADARVDVRAAAAGDLVEVRLDVRELGGAPAGRHPHFGVGARLDICPRSVRGRLSGAGPMADEGCSSRPSLPAKENPVPMKTATARRMSAEETLALWQQYKATNDRKLRDRLVLTFAPLVKYIVYKKAREMPARCEVEDFISCGLEALMISIDRYDPAKGATLEQYAWTRIHGAVLDELRRQDWAPRSVRRWE